MRARAARKKQPQRGPLQALYDSDQVARAQAQIDIITPEQRAKGIYDCKKRPVVNRGGDPVQRWTWGGRLSDRQKLAIEVCIRLWEKAGLKQRITQKYGTRVPSAASDWVELRAHDEIEARAHLYRLQGLIPDMYWDVFENVCRHGEPAGVAGSRLGWGSRSAQERAHTIVCVVADIIANSERL